MNGEYFFLDEVRQFVALGCRTYPIRMRMRQSYSSRSALLCLRTRTARCIRQCHTCQTRPGRRLAIPKSRACGSGRRYWRLPQRQLPNAYRDHRHRSSGHYTGLLFTVGVPFALDHVDAATAPAPLNFTAMNWVWQAGFKFIRSEILLVQDKPNTGVSPSAAYQRAPVDLR